MKEKWILQQKKADFDAISKEQNIAPLIARCIVNRDINSMSEIEKYLYGGLDDLYDWSFMKGIKEAIQIVDKCKQKAYKVAIASDFDCDGIFSGYILWLAFKRIGMDVKIYTPDRVKEGYGLNERIVDEALSEDRKLLVTCDNGIAAISQVDYAKKKGMTVIVTDHHDIQKVLPKADAVIDPKQEEETYPVSTLCGAGVAFKFICGLYDFYKIDKKEQYELLEYVAIATVADIMELRDENRIIVKYGLKALENTKNIGLRALIEAQGLDGKTINAGHIGFVIGPCFNAAGRITTVKESFDLLTETDKIRAKNMAEHLKEVNEKRKEMTENGAERATEIVERMADEKGLPDVLVILLEDVHESLVGIIAGRIKEKYCHPTIVFTKTEEGIIKGSGRSIEAYDMFSELMRVEDLFIHFGGHKMAAGMTLYEKDLDELTSRLNANSCLSCDDFCPVVMIDAAMPIGYVTEELIRQFSLMEPFGVGNTKPIFAEQHFRVDKAFRLGKNRNVLKLKVRNEKGSRRDALMFRGADDFDEFIRENFGQIELDRMYEGRENHVDVALTYYPDINEYNGVKTIQIQIVGYCRVER